MKKRVIVFFSLLLMFLLSTIASAEDAYNVGIYDFPPEKIILDWSFDVLARQSKPVSCQNLYLPLGEEYFIGISHSNLGEHISIYTEGYPIIKEMPKNFGSMHYDQHHIYIVPQKLGKQTILVCKKNYSYIIYLTVTEPGTEIKTEDVEYNKYNHVCNYAKKIIKNPTCEENGSYKMYCTFKECGNVSAGTYAIFAKGHKWGDWVVVKESTPYSRGALERVCSVCGKKKTKILPKESVYIKAIKVKCKGLSGKTLKIKNEKRVTMSISTNPSYVNEYLKAYSSNKNIVSVSKNGNKCNVIAKKKGRAKITFWLEWERYCINVIVS